MSAQKRNSIKPKSGALIARNDKLPEIKADHTPEIIRSDIVLEKASIVIPEKETDKMKVKAAGRIAAAGLAIGVFFLTVSIYLNDSEIRTWSMGLITFVLGTVLGYGFSHTSTKNS